jgi:membrane-associated phospholipid phosphatase
MLPFYVCLCCATVYIQAHYLIDAMAGFVTAVVFYILVSRAFKRWFV